MFFCDFPGQRNIEEEDKILIHHNKIAKSSCSGSLAWTQQTCNSSPSPELLLAMQNKPLSATRLTACVSTTRPLEVVPNNWLTQLIPLKICRKCQEAKADKDFHRNTRLPGGFEHHCKSCRAEGDNLRRLEKQQQVDTVTDKQCRNCGQTKPADCFQRTAAIAKSASEKCKDLWR